MQDITVGGPVQGEGLDEAFEEISSENSNRSWANRRDRKVQGHQTYKGKAGSAVLEGRERIQGRSHKP